MQFQPQHSRLEKFNTDNNEIHIHHYLNILYRYKFVIIILILLFSIGGVILSLLLPPIFQSSTTLELAYNQKELLQSKENVITESQSPKFIEILKSKLNMDKTTLDSDVLGIFSIRPNETEKLLTIKGNAETPEKAKNIAEAVLGTIIEEQNILYTENSIFYASQIELIEQQKEKTNQKIEFYNSLLNTLTINLNFYQQEVIKRQNADSDGQGRIVETYINLVSSTNARIFKIQSEQLDLKSKIRELENTIKQINFKKNQELHASKIISSPNLPMIKIAPNRKNICLTALFVGIFSSIIITLMLNYFRKYKKQIIES